MSLTFRKPTARDASEIEAFKAEFAVDGSSMDGTGILFRASAEEWLNYIDQMETDAPGRVPCLQYGLFDEDGCLLGLLQIRLRLLGYLADFGGHIGYCVRPSARRRGHAKDMLQRALNLCRSHGLERVLVTCLEDNVGSARTIEACGGVMEKVVFDDCNYLANMKRYWIALQ